MSKARAAGKGSEKTGVTDDSDSIASVAARAEAELQELVRLSEALEHIALDNEKRLDRAIEIVQLASASQSRFVETMTKVVGAVGRAKDRFGAAAEIIGNRAHEVEGKSTLFHALRSRCEKVREATRAVSELARTLGQKRKELASGGRPEDLIRQLDAIRTQLEVVVNEAVSIAREAEAASFMDLAREAEGLRKQLLSAKNQLGLLEHP